MPPLILLGLLTGIPLVLTAGLRVKPLYVFVSIMCGYFWAQLLGDPVELMLRSVTRAGHMDVIVRIALLIIPLAITLLLMRKSLSASALPFQFVLLVADAILLVTFLVPLLTPGVQGAINSTNAGNIFRQAHDITIPAVAGIHVLVMWIMRPRHENGRAKHRRH